MKSTSPSTPLPPAVQSALLAIAKDLRHVPRESCASFPDVFLYLRRMAARVDGVRDMKVFAGPKPPPRPPAPRPITPREKAEAVFVGSAKSIRRIERRTVTSRRGRRVSVEVRQLEMSL